MTDATHFISACTGDDEPEGLRQCPRCFKRNAMRCDYDRNESHCRFCPFEECLGCYKSVEACVCKPDDCNCDPE